MTIGFGRAAEWGICAIKACCRGGEIVLQGTSLLGASLKWTLAPHHHLLRTYSITQSVFYCMHCRCIVSISIFKFSPQAKIQGTFKTRNCSQHNAEKEEET